MKIIRGNTVGTPMKRPDFNQTDPKKSDYIKNNPLPPITKEDEGKVLKVGGGKFVLDEDNSDHTHDATQALSEITNLKAIAIGNTWILDEEKIKSGDDFTKDFKFVSNGIAFEQIARYYSTDSGNDEYVLQYRNSDTSTYRDVYRCDLYGGGWSDDAFKTIRTADNINLEDIATKVESTNDLMTEAKTFIDAINELSRGIKLVPAYYKEPVVDEDGNEVEEGKWFWEKDEFGNFVREVAITALVGGDNKFVLYDVGNIGLFQGGGIRILSPEINVDVETVESLFDFIDQTLLLMWDRLPDVAKTAITNLIQNTYQSIIDSLEAGYNAIIDWFGNVGENLENFSEAAKAKIDEIFNAIFVETIGKSLKELWEYIQSKINELIENSKNDLTKLYETVKTDINNAIELFKQKVTDAIEAALNSLKESVTNLTDLVNNTIKVGLEEAQDWINDTGEGIKKWINDTGTQVAYKMDEIVEFFGGDLVPDQNFAQITESGYNAFVKNNSIDTLDTLDTTVVGGINELNRMIQGNTWVLDEEALLQADSFTKDFKFVSNGIEFEQMVYRDESDGANDYHILQYRNNTTDTYMGAYIDGWIDRAFRTVFTYNTRISLEDIATIDNYTREDLDTNDKTIVGAINEVNASVNDAKGILQNIIDGYTEVDSAKFARKADELSGASNLTTTNKTTIGAINEVNNKVVSSITELEDNAANGVTVKSSGVAWNGLSKIHYGDGKYVDITRSTNIPLVAGENVTFEVDQESDIVKVNAKVDTSNLATVDKIGEIYTSDGNTENIDVNDFGIEWGQTFGICDDDGGYIKSGYIGQRIPLVAGEGVNFEVDGNAVKINATGGSSADNTIVGKWKFNDTIDFTNDSFEVSFTSNGNDYVAIEDDGGGDDDAGGLYYSVELYDQTDMVYNFMENYWTDETYRTITITEEPTDAEFITWLKANAKKQEAVGVDKVECLTLNEGEFADMYAEDFGFGWRQAFGTYDEDDNCIKSGVVTQVVPLVAGKGIEFEVDEENQVVKINATGGGSTDDSYISKYVVEITGSENVVDIINKLTTTYPDYQLGVWGLVEFTGATSGLYGLTINHYGGNVYNISGADFGTFYSMANNVKDWSQVSVWGFSGEFQPPIPYCDDSNNGQVLKVVNGVPTWVTL